MKDHHDTSTIDAFEKRGAGRPRRYASNAERQAAYRARRSAVSLSASVVPVQSAPVSGAAFDLVGAARFLIARLLPQSCLMMRHAERMQAFDELTGAYRLAVMAGCDEAAVLLNDACERVLKEKV